MRHVVIPLIEKDGVTSSPFHPGLVHGYKPGTIRNNMADFDGGDKLIAICANQNMLIYRHIIIYNYWCLRRPISKFIGV